MSTVGLTKAMRRALEAAKCVCPLGRMYDALIRRGLITSNRTAEFGFTHEITPRGHAALAAPRMTQAELETLENCEADLYVTLRMPSGHEWLTLGRLRDAGFVSPLGFSLTPAGRTALNNVRAAMGSPEYKDGL